MPLDEPGRAKEEEMRTEVRYTEYYTGVIGRITEIHAVYYHEHWGFDITFETQVGSELSHFMAGFVKGRDYFQAARTESDFAGAIAIDGSRAEDEGARLRWFIVDPACQGSGIGGRLIQKAMAFCRQAGHEKVFLWTFEGLHCARRLYERAGFRLAEEHDVEQWGTRIREQKFEVALASVQSLEPFS
jgi:GNAT superfamily N-acetyltransferase